MAKVMKMLNFKSNKLHKDTRVFSSSPASQLSPSKEVLEDKSRPQEAEEEGNLELVTSEEDSSNFAGDKRRVSISKSGRFTLKESQTRVALTILNHDDDDEGDSKTKKGPTLNNDNKKTENDKENVEIRTKCKDLKNQVNEERRESCCSVLDGNAVVAEIESLALQEQSRQATLVTDL